ncbi:MAG: hypothetical protein QOD45_99 [Pseudonocardiales bacterium]|nr:hypothetical protein [Pseudonocardiales bacterium]
MAVPKAQQAAPAPARLWRPSAENALPPAPPMGLPVQPGGVWLAEPTPNPTTPTGYLTSVACPGSMSCIAVGTADDATGNIAALVERWDGSRWSLQVAADPAQAAETVLTAVSCSTADACTAVGYYYDSAGNIRTLAERSTGARWQIVPTPNPTGAQASGLFAVSCPSPSACTAVGTYNSRTGTPLTLGERWDGAVWRLQRTANRSGAIASQLSAVSCASARACTATGSLVDSAGAQLTLAETWAGSGWTIDSTPDPASATASNLTAVSCTAAGACFAVGYFSDSTGTTRAFAEARGNTTSTWTLEPIPGPVGAEFSGVSCTSASACTAAGTADTGAMAQRWNGTSWTRQDSQASQASGFAGISCASPRSCVAVGYTKISVGYPRTLADAWNGTSWRVQTSANASGATESTLAAASCTAPYSCVAVGSHTTPADKTLALAEKLDGRRWTVQDILSAPGSLNTHLDAISCASPAGCTAVGYYNVSPGVDATLAESWNGDVWKIQPTPAPAGAVGSHLRGVSCVQQACTAVGEYMDSVGVLWAFAEQWTSSGWHVQRAPTPGHATGSQLSAVWCTSSSVCTAVGYYNTRAGVQTTLAEVWNGTSWEIEHPAVPDGAVASQLAGVVCTSANGCTAVGSYVNQVGATFTLAERRVGTTWDVQPTSNAPGALATVLTALSCTSSQVCAATGYKYYLSSSGHPLPPVAIAETWSGHRWVMETVASPSGTASSVLTGASCLATQCTAVGFRFGSAGHEVTFAVGRLDRLPPS